MTRNEAMRSRRLLHGVIAPLSVCLIALSLACAPGQTPPPGGPDAAYEQRIVEARAAKDASFKSSTDSPLPAAARSSFAGLSYFPINAMYRVAALLTKEPSAKPLVIELQTSTGGRDQYRRVGRLGFTLNGVPYSLAAFASADDQALNRLFVPFGDLTNGAETYHGGRFIELDRTPTGFYDLDFNRAYHPNCVYSPAWECPVPPRENRLPVAIRAGEKLSGQ